MNLAEAILLGILQGITEFLPISSTAHLTIAGRALGLIDDNNPQEWTAFLAVVQLGTLAAVLWYFRRDLAALAQGDRKTWQLAGLVLLGTIPIAIIGLALRDVIEGPLTKDLRIIGTVLIALGLLLGAADRWGKRQRTVDSLTWRDAIIVGAAQTLSLFPGSSRSGVTLTGGLLTGLDREAAARYSFLLSIPAIAASGILQLPAIARAQTLDGTTVFIAALAAAVSGYLAVAWMLRFLRTRSTAAFVIYRCALGAGVLAAVATGLV